MGWRARADTSGRAPTGTTPGVPGGFGAHGNPRDFQLMLGRLEDPGRAR